MYTYTFTICLPSSPQEPYITISLTGKDRVRPYESILIQKFNEKREDWSTSVYDSYIKEVPWSGKLFFDWLSEQRLLSYGGCCCISIDEFSPYELYTVLDKSDEYKFTFDSNDPEDIEDPGSYYNDMHNPYVIY